LIGFISQAHLPPADYSFKRFQDLPILIRSALAWATKQQAAGLECGIRDVTRHIISNYSNRQYLAIGELIEKLNEFVSCPVCCRMVRCYVDHSCNMIAAKLAWHEDY
jgi:hypothetical protein